MSEGINTTCKNCDHSMFVDQVFMDNDHIWGECIPQQSDGRWIKLPDGVEWADAAEVIRGHSSGMGTAFGAEVGGYIRDGWYHLRTCWCGCNRPEPSFQICTVCKQPSGRLRVMAHNNRVERVCDNCEAELMPIVLEHEGMIQHISMRSRP